MMSYLYKYLLLWKLYKKEKFMYSIEYMPHKTTMKNEIKH